jgi:hypothetical protein
MGFEGSTHRLHFLLFDNNSKVENTISFVSSGFQTNSTVRLTREPLLKGSSVRFTSLYYVVTRLTSKFVSKAKNQKSIFSHTNEFLK